MSPRQSDTVRLPLAPCGRGPTHRWTWTGGYVAADLVDVAAAISYRSASSRPMSAKLSSQVGKSAAFDSKAT